MSALILGVYSILTLLGGRVAYRALRASEFGGGANSTDSTDRAATGALALIIGMFWPLALPVAIITWKPAKTPAELKAEVEARDRRIRELETELGIRGDR